MLDDNVIRTLLAYGEVAGNNAVTLMRASRLSEAAAQLRIAATLSQAADILTAIRASTTPSIPTTKE